MNTQQNQSDSQVSQPIPEIISPTIRQFLVAYDLEEIEARKHESTANLQVSRAASTLALVYEKIRQAIDYQEEQVLRRRAIERILLRRITSTKSTDREISEGFIKEVTWARYVPNNSLPPERVNEVALIISRYKVLLERNTYKQTKRLPDLRDWILGVMSTEIEQLLLPHHVIDALVHLMYTSLDHTDSTPDVDDATKNLQIYLTIHRALLKSDKSVLRFKLLMSYYPDWQSNNPELTEQVASQFIQAVEAIEYHINHPLGDRLLPLIRKQTAPFLVLKAVIDGNKKKRKEILAVHELREEAVRSLCKEKYKAISTKIRRAAFRSIIYLFITKMVLAFIIEIPMDKYLYGEILPIPLAINVLFPPLLMFLVSTTIRTPNNRNTDKIVARLNTIIDDPDGENSVKIIIPKTPKRSLVYVYVYITTFIISFGLIWILLSRLHFNFISKGLFFLFTCLVSFFAFRIRQTSQELVLIDDKESFIASIIDFFFLPFLRVGRWLSYGFSKINVFIFIFDFILEAPLKSIITIAEEWFTFIREKKDEIV